MLPIAILAGGLGTRLHPMTTALPKALIPICNEPFIAHQLRLLRAGGFENVVLCVGYLGEQIQEFVGNGEQFGLHVEYSWDGEAPAGTAGALIRALPLLGSAFFAIYGDSYLPCDYRAAESAFLSSRKQGLMTVYRNEGRWDASNVEFADGRIVAYDKRQPTPRMQFIDYGLSAFQSSAFDAISELPADLSSVHQRLAIEGSLEGFEVQQRFYEVGSFEGIQSFTALIERKIEDEGRRNP
jgi:N-acetyl-alpha-D-muramate 1-phosphate uridylyltransferase